MKTGLITSEEAAKRLNVKRATVYSYVSRGLIEPRETHRSKGSLFDAMEIEHLANRGRKSRKADGAGPMFMSAITNIHNGEYYYRGRSACELARQNDYEDVVAYLWQTDPDRLKFSPNAEMAAELRHQTQVLPAYVLPFERMKIMISLAAPLDPMRHDLNPGAVINRVSTLMATMVDVIPLPKGGASFRPANSEPGFVRHLWSHLSATPPEDELFRALNAALIVTADADVTSPTTIAARMGASVNADIYSVLAAGMHCSGGPVQSASSLAVESYLDGLNNDKSINQFIGERLREGHSLPGFGHHRFPEGDRRAQTILEILTSLAGTNSRARKLAEFLEIQQQRGIEPPNIGFAIAALAYVAGMVRGSGDLIFAFARMAGWTAHAIEQYQSAGESARAPSLYVGPAPGKGARLRAEQIAAS